MILNLYIMRKSILLKVSAVVLSVLVVSCAEEKKKEKESYHSQPRVELSESEKDSVLLDSPIILDDALVVAKVELGQLLNKSLYDGSSTSSTLLHMIKDKARQIEDKYVRDYVLNTLDYPSDCGLDLNSPLVLSVDYQNEDDLVACLSAKISDYEKVYGFIDSLYNASPQRQADSELDYIDEYDYYEAVDALLLEYEYDEYDGGIDKKIEADGLTFYCSDGGAIVLDHQNIALYITSAELDEYEFDEINKLFKRGKAPELNNIAEFLYVKDDLSMWLDYEYIMSFMMAELRKDYRLQDFMPYLDNVKYDGSSAVLALNFETGKTTMTTHIDGIVYEDIFFTESSDKYFKYIPEDAVLVANIKIKDFLSLWEFFKKSKTVKETLEQFEFMLGLDDDFIQSMPGTITFAVDGRTLSNDIPGFVAAFECDHKVYEKLLAFMRKAEMRSVDDGYILSNAVYITYKDGAIILMENNLWRRSNNCRFEDSYSSDKIAEGGISVKLRNIFPYIINEIDLGINYHEILELVEEIDFVPESFYSADLVLSMGDKKSNLIQKVLDLIVR